MAISLKNALPAALSLILVSGLAMSGIDSVVRGRAALVVEARADLQDMAASLVRAAERASLSDTSDLASEITLKAADRRVALIAMIDPEGTVVMASRLAWRGQPAGEVLEGFDKARFDRTVLEHEREMRESDDGTRLSLMVPYDERTEEQKMRNLAHGAIRVDLDLSYDVKLIRHEMFRHLARQLGVAILLMLLLGWMLRRMVTRPLQRMEQAAQAFAASGTVEQPLPESGPRELAELARNFNDMTRRIETARAEADASASRLSGVVDAAMDAILTVDAQQTIRLVNPAGAQMFGYPQDQLVGMSLERLLPERFRQTHQEWLKRFATSGTTTRTMGRQTLVYGLRRDGEEFPAEASISRLRVAGEDLLTVILRDVTERKKAEDYIIALNDSLEERVATRTAALAEANERLRLREAELEDAKVRAEGASRMKSDFLANMSHEIRTPMNAIVGMAHLALKTPLDARQQDYLKKIQQSAHHLLGIINDILDLSKIEADKLTLERIDFQLSRVLDNFTNLLADKAAAKGLELIFEVDADVPDHLLGDPLRVGQVLINYGNNALKFTRRGEIHVRVSCVEQNESSVLLRFEVRDTGIGIKPEQVGRLFQSFEQADTSISRQYGGTGLGLSISRRLAELMGGGVGVDSRWGQGSTFWFTARLGKSQLSSPMLRPSAKASDHRLLVVDDNETARDALQEMLQRLGFAVSTVDGGEAALNAVQQAEREGRPYDVVLLDWQMPGMDGLEVGRHLRAMALSRRPHLMLVTGFGREEVFEHAGRGDFAAVLVKPVNPSMLLDHLMDALQGAQPFLPDRGVTQMAELTTGLAGVKGARILAVDDNEVNLQVARELLEDAGFQVDTADDGAKAVEQVRQSAYDLVLMDMQMPVMDGLAATRAIRALNEHATVPIVAMTANAMEQDRQRCLDAGMNDFLAKPLDPERLFEVVRAWVRGGLAAPQPAAPVVETEPLPEGWDRIEGLDTGAGLRRVRGRVASYRALMERFIASQRSAPAEIADAIAQGDRERATRLAHTLKGVAGNLGATLVQDLAAAVEAGLRQWLPPARVDQAVQQLAEAMQALVHALGPTAAPAATLAAVPGAPVDAQALALVVAELRRQLADGDPAAQENATANAALLRAGLGSGWTVFEESLRSFDFDEALHHLEPLQEGQTST
jgi:PAS domain S-box-containing protein